MDRIEWLRNGIPFEEPGIEIGPLDRPVMPRPESAVCYADHLDRTGLVAKYEAHAGVNSDAIPEIDFVIGAEGLRAAIGDRQFHYLIASHVIEHVPNPIGWLQDIHGLLKDGGVVALAIPDRRRCFDALRRETTPAEWIEAALFNHVRPSPSRIFDALSNEVTLNGNISWAHDCEPNELRLSRTAAHALHITQRVLATDDYFDVHCWTFTPESFSNLMRTVVSTGLIKLKLLEASGTQGGEFFVRLGRDDAMDATALRCTYPAAGGRYDELPHSFDAARYCELNPDVAAAGVDPNDHYIEFGRREGRRWS